MKSDLSLLESASKSQFNLNIQHNSQAFIKKSLQRQPTKTSQTEYCDTSAKRPAHPKRRTKMSSLQPSFTATGTNFFIHKRFESSGKQHGHSIHQAAISEIPKSIQTQKLRSIQKGIIETEKGIKQDLGTLQNEMMLNLLYNQNSKSVESQISELAGSTLVNFQAQLLKDQKTSLKLRLMQQNVLHEYKSGICDPTRIVAKQEKGPNKQLMKQRLEVKKLINRAYNTSAKYGL